MTIVEPRRSPPASSALRDATVAAAEYLLASTDPGGGWSDYELPVGASDQWVTAHVAGALQLCSQSGLAPAGLGHALELADAALGEPDAACHGWGFNQAAGPDADSTALAMLFLARRGRVLASEARFLAAHRQQDGGFATFIAADAWGVSHPCVTPTVALALLEVGQLDVAGVVRYVRKTEWQDGTWPSYWWRGCHYATYWNLVLLHAAGQPVEPRRPVVGGRETAEIRSVLDLACVVGIVHQRLGDRAAREVLGALLGEQRSDGGFDGGADLRVTRATCLRPWDDPQGDLYRDDRGLLTTAMALRVMSQLPSGGAR